jgi:hypothetical protein
MRAPPSRSKASPPLHLRAVDFDAYLLERAPSNALTRTRLELKQRIVAWSRAVMVRLSRVAHVGEVSVAVEVNERRADCQRVFFWRDAAAQVALERLLDSARPLAAKPGDPAPHTHHAYLALKLDSTHVAVSLEVHPEAWVDLENLRARLSDPVRALELTTALQALPEQFALGRGQPDATSVEAQRATADELRALVDSVEKQDAQATTEPLATTPKRVVWIGWRVPRDVAIAHSELLDEQLEDAIVALGPVLKLVAWAPDNDLVVLDREGDPARAPRARTRDGERESARSDWESGRDGERRTRAKKRDAADAKWTPQAERPRQRDAEGGDESRSKAPPKAITKRAQPARETLKARTPVPRRAPTVTEVDPHAPIEKGTRVRVLSGPFEGKVGVVQGKDGESGARVMLGLLAMRFEVKELIAVADGKDRPMLASSHRRPLPARS